MHSWITGSSVVYVVPAGKYNSTTSQAAADQFAINDVAANGQAYANANGTCNGNATISANNIAHVSGYSVKYTNTTTMAVTTFTIPTAGGTLGTLPVGTYNVHIAKAGGTITYQFSVNCNSLTIAGVSADFSSVAISPTACNGIVIDFP